MVASHHQLRHKLINRFASLHHEHESYRWWLLANVMIGTFMAVLDATIVNVGLPKIMAAFGSSIDKVEWIVTSYMLVFAVMLPTSGWVADRFGYKRTYFASLLLFTIGSLLCGLSWDENSLIFFRVIQGIGAGLMMPVGMAIVTREFPPEQRGMALGFWGIAAAASVSFGPLIGGYLIDHLSWQSIFYVNVPVGAFGLLATLVVQREYKPDLSKSFDLVGFLSVSLFLTSLLIALSSGNSAWNIGGWTSPFITSCFILSLLGLVVFLVTEFTVAHPLIELRLLKNFNFGVANGIMFIFGLGMFGSTFLLPIYLQNSLGYTALQAGAVFLPVGIVQGFFSPISGMIGDRFNPKIPITVGIILMSASFYLNSLLSLYTEQPQITFLLIMRGVGLGLIFTPLSAIALTEISKREMAQASGIFNVIRQIGGSFGVAILGTLLTQRTIFHTAAFSQAVDQNSPFFRQVVTNIQNYSSTSLGSTSYNAATQAKSVIGAHLANQAFVQAVNDCFLITALVTLVSILPVFFLRYRKPQTKAHSQLQTTPLTEEVIND